MVLRIHKFASLSLAMTLAMACGKPKALELDEDSGLSNNQECDAEGKNCIGIGTIGDATLTCQLIASSGKVNKGQSVTLTISTSAPLTAAEINSFTISDVKVPKLSLSPQSTTNYDAKITSATGTTATCSVRVEVVESNGNPIPMCTLSAPKTTINEGESIRISMVASNATSGSLQDVTMTGTTTEKTVSPTSDTSYEGKVAGPGGNNTCNIAILVIPKVVGPRIMPTCSLTASKASIQRGQSVTLTMASSNATSATLDKATASTGSFIKSFSPTETKTFLGTVNNADGNGQCDVTVEVTDPPVAAPTCTISVSPKVGLPGTNVNVTYTSKNATSAILNGSFAQIGSGSAGFTANSTTNYTYTVTNSAGVSTTCVDTVEIGSAPTCTMTASSTLVNSGTYVSVGISPTNATEISINGSALSLSSPARNILVTSKTTFVGTAKNKYGSANCSNSPVVNVILQAKMCQANATNTPCLCGAGQVRRSATFVAPSSACRMEAYSSTGIQCIFQSYAGLPCNGCYLVCQTQ